MNKETVHSVKEKSMYRNAIQLNTDVKERTNEEGLMNHRKGKKRERKWWKHQGLHATEVPKKKKRKKGKCTEQRHVPKSSSFYRVTSASRELRQPAGNSCLVSR